MTPVKLSKKEFLGAILALWELEPELRFGQLVARAGKGRRGCEGFTLQALAYLFDEEFLNLFELTSTKPPTVRRGSQVLRLLQPACASRRP
jgi:hypothetical protein